MHGRQARMQAGRPAKQEDRQTGVQTGKQADTWTQHEHCLPSSVILDNTVKTLDLRQGWTPETAVWHIVRLSLDAQPCSKSRGLDHQMSDRAILHIISRLVLTLRALIPGRHKDFALVCSKC